MTFEEQLKKDGKLVYTNKGVSMMPLLRQGRDIMVIEDVTDKELKNYDAVLFIRKKGNQEKQYVMHRILKINPDGTYWIVGDHCVTGDIVQREAIIGRLTGVFRDEKLIQVTDKKYQFYVHLWCDFYPIRFFLLRSKWFVYRGLRFIKRRVLRQNGK